MLLTPLLVVDAQTPSSGSTTDSRRAEADTGRTPAQAVGVGFRIVLGIVVIVIDAAPVLRSLGIRM
jgi:hypothetical protein